MGMDETQSKELSGGSCPVPESDNMVQCSEQEKKELDEALGGLRNGEGLCGVAEDGTGFSSFGNEGLDDRGVVEVVKSSSVLETKVSFLSENEGQVLVDSEMNGVSSLLETQNSGIGTVFSSDGAEKLDYDFASESRVSEANVLSVDGSVVVGEGDGRNGEVSEEEEKDEDCDGNIVTIEVPIAETTENIDLEVEELCDEGYGFTVGDFVWGKVKSKHWWPGRVYDPSDASRLALKLKQKHGFLVAFFGNGTFAWCQPSQLKPFEENFDDMVKQSSSVAFVNAVQETMNEVGKLWYLKTSHSFDAKKTISEFTPPLVKNSGIKEGVFVPANGIEKLLDVLIEPAELLSRVKQVAEIIDIASILELEILKAQLSAFYLTRGGYKLPDYIDPQPVPGFEDSLMGETDDGCSSRNVVEAPVKGPFEEDCSILPVGPKFDELCQFPGLSGNILSHRRKQKSIAEIMGEDKDVHAKNSEGNATDEMLDAIESSGRKKRKGGEDAMASKSIQKKKHLPLDTDSNMPSAENDGSEGKENSSICTPTQSKDNKQAFGNDNISSGSKMETDEGKINEQNEKGYLSRERKKSKYLSPPFTTSIRGLRKGSIETEFLLSSKAKVSRGTARTAGQPSPVKCYGEAFQDNFSKEVAVERKLSDKSNYQPQKDDEKKTIDPKKIQAPAGEVLSQVHYAAISPLIPRESSCFDQFVDYISVFRNSLYRQGSLHKLYKKHQLGRKRKKPESEHEMLRKDQNQCDHVSPNHVPEPTKRRKETTPGMPKVKRTRETTTGKKGTDENAPGAVLYVSFWPGSSLPSRSDLIRAYSKFGSLNEGETDMFRTNYTARVSFQSTCDAEEALNHSQNNNPFGSSDVTFQLQYPSSGSMSAQHAERSKCKPAPAKKKGKTPATPSVSPLHGGEASKLIFIKQKLQGLTSMLEASSGKSPDMITKLESEMKVLLEDVKKMVVSCSS